MKKTSRILAIFICLIAIVATVVITTFATSDKGKGEIKETTSIGFSDKGSLICPKNNPSIIESMANQSRVFKKWEKETGYNATALPFFNIGCDWKWAPLEGSLADATLVTLEFDLSTDSNYLPLQFFQLESKGAGGTNARSKYFGRLDPDGTYHGNLDGKTNIVNLGTEPYDWNHFIILINIKTGFVTTFINNEMADRGVFFSDAEANPVITMSSVRWYLQMNAPDIDGGYSTCMQGLTYRVFDSTSALSRFTDSKRFEADRPLDDMERGVRAYEGLTFNNENYQYLNREYLYEVDGKGTTNFEIAKKLAVSTKSPVKVLCNIKKGTHLIDSEMVVDTQGNKFEYEAKGFVVTRDRNLIIFSSSNLPKKIEFYDGDTLLKKMTVPVGTEVVFDDVPKQKEVNGENLIFIGWGLNPGDETPLPSIPNVENDAKYYAIYKKAYAIIKKSDGSVFTFESRKDLGFVLNYADEGSCVTFYGDVSYKATSPLIINNSLTIDLGTHALTMEHSLMQVGATVANFTLKNGTVNPNEGNNFLQIFNGNPNVNLENLTFTGYSTYVDIRCGILNIVGCTFNSRISNPNAKGYNIVQGGARGETQIEVNFIDTVINTDPYKDITKLFYSGRKTSGSGVGKGIKIFVNFKGVTVNGPLQRVVDVQNKKDGTKTTVEATIDKNCVFNTNRCVLLCPGVVNDSATVENGAKSKAPFGIDKGMKSKFGQGNSVIFFDGEYYTVAEKLVNADAYININSNLNLIYIVDAGENVSPKMIFTLKGFEYTTVGEKLPDGKFAFSFSNIDPRYFGETVSCALVNDDGSIASASIESMSVKKYCDTLLQTYSNNSKIVALASDILRYGASAQKALGYRVDDLVTEGLSGKLSDEREITPNSIKKVGESKDENNKILSVGVILKGSVGVYVDVKIENLQSSELTVNGEPMFFESKGDGIYRIYYNGINAYEFDRELKISLLVNGQTVGEALYSVNSYIASMKNSSASVEIKELINALGAYGESAKAYYEEIHRA